jgi:hypothetical protein
MSPLFGHHDDATDQSQDLAALQTEVARLESLSLPQLAAQVMTKGFGPGGPGADPQNQISTGGANINAGPEVSDIALAFAPGGNTRAADDQLRLRLYKVVAEGLQVLEHACLIRAQMHTSMNGLDYAITRLGRSALERGEVDRVLGAG